MKRPMIFSLLVVICASVGVSPSHAQSDALAGAWHTKTGDIEQTAVFVDGLVSHSTFDVKNKKFIATRGGTYTHNNGQLAITAARATDKAAAKLPLATWPCTTTTSTANVGNTLSTERSGTNAEWRRRASNDKPRAGVAYMTGRGADAKIASDHAPGDRRTYKIL